jgi:hypothetical protein
MCAGAQASQTTWMLEGPYALESSSTYYFKRQPQELCGTSMVWLGMFWYVLHAALLHN